MVPRDNLLASNSSIPREFALKVGSNCANLAPRVIDCGRKDSVTNVSDVPNYAFRKSVLGDEMTFPL